MKGTKLSLLREILIGRHLEPNDLILLEMELLIGEDVTEVAEFCAFHGRKEDVHCIRMSLERPVLPC